MKLFNAILGISILAMACYYQHKNEYSKATYHLVLAIWIIKG